MKFFISYCQKDWEVLKYAHKAKEMLKQRDIEAWVWADDSSSAELLKTDIAKNIDSCAAMLTIVTTGTKDSAPQKEEWSWASSYGKVNSSLRKQGLPVPDELKARYCPEFSEADFEKICNKVIGDIVEHLGDENRKQSEETTANEYQLHDLTKQLERNQEGLRKQTIEEFNKSVWEGYLGSAIVRNVVRFGKANDTDKSKLLHIVINKLVELDKFNAENYLWGLAFKQIGSEIAKGEKRYLIKRIKEEVEEFKESCDEANDELSTIEKEIKKLSKNGYEPNIILAPASMLKSFVHFFREGKGKINFTRELGSAAVLEMEEDVKLGIYLLSSSILSTNVMIYDKSNILWKICLNPDTDYVLTMGVGKRFYPDRVSLTVGTTVTCIVKDKQGIIRIPIKR